MGALPSQSCINFSRSICSSRVVQPRISSEKFTSVTVEKVLRRSILRIIGFSPVLRNACALIAVSLPEMKEPDVTSIQDTEAGQWSQDTRNC